MKYDSIFSLKFILGTLIFIMGSLSVLLISGHSQLRVQMNRVVELQDEYHTYTVAFQSMLQDYQRLKENELAISFSDDSKKKSEISVVSFSEQPFLVVNREPEYLKESLVEYARERRMGDLVEKLERYDEHGNKKVTPRRKKRRNRNDSSLLSRQLKTKKSRTNNDINLSWPINRSKFWISSFYGVRRQPNRTWGFHSGVDMAAIKGTPVYASKAGVVVEAGVNTGYGNTIVVVHNKKYKTRYAHLKNIICRVGDRVKEGQHIGSVGDTGLVRKKGRSASHLHFELYAFGKQVNPLHYLV